jgi:hypothetical protein
MKLSAFPVLIFFSLAVVSCNAESTVVPSTAAPTDTQAPATSTPAVTASTETPAGPLGSISGSVLPPTVAQPATVLKVFAREKDTGKLYSADFPVDQTQYTIPDIPFGRYIVVAWYYPDGIPGAYTSAGIKEVTTSSEQLRCNNSLVEIVLTEKDPDYRGADLTCWAGDYFFYMTPVP